MTTRVVYQQELQMLNNAVLDMSNELQKSIICTVEALKNVDADKAKQIIKNDDIIDTIERTIETTCIEIIAKQAPIAGDLRKISAYMRMIADIERIADHCSDISEYIILLANEKEVPMPEGICEMLSEMRQMSEMVIESFIENDFIKAGKVIEHDDIVDDYFENIKIEIGHAMKHNSDKIFAYINYLMIVKYIERMADHCTNLAHWVQFVVSGQLEL